MPLLSGIGQYQFFFLQFYAHVNLKVNNFLLCTYPRGNLRIKVMGGASTDASSQGAISDNFFNKKVGHWWQIQTRSSL